MSNLPYVIIITGPTASGKSAFSIKISEFFDIEVINIDIGQFYAQLKIGTAKPDWKNEKIHHHCFDLIDCPKDITVFDFNKIILNKIKEICGRNKIPVLVGGSLFYIKSLFFPLKKLPTSKKKSSLYIDNNFSPWERLNLIDPQRAMAIHKNDIYRIRKALEIWEKTGAKPSEYKPEFGPKVSARILYLKPDKKELHEKINKRTVEMIKSGWINECENLIGTKWDIFLKSKKIIGYPEIFEWIKTGKDPQKIDVLIETIQIKTRRYAKRQKTFFEGLKKKLARFQKNICENKRSINISYLKKIDDQAISLIVRQIQNDLKNQS